MELSQLRYAVTVAKLNSFTKAAKCLHITQPTLSQQIAKLESEIGLVLFIRSTRSVKVTDAGRIFLDYSNAVLDAYDTLTQQVEKLKDHRNFPIRIGMLPTFKHLNILDIIEKYQGSFPDALISLYLNHSEDLIKMLHSDQLDLIICNIFPNIDYKTDYVLSEFHRDPIHAVVNANHPLSNFDEINWEKLNGETLLMLSKASSIRKYMESALKAKSIRAKLILECPTIDSMMGMIQSNIGVGFLSSQVALQYISPAFRQISLHPPAETVTAAVYPKTSK